ncbi:MAG: GIN domain-containing protein [Vitreoscilla sp.]
MNRHLILAAWLALSLDAVPAIAQDGPPADAAQQRADQAQQQAEQAQQRVDQARREAEQARRDADQARRAADVARKQALKAEQAQRDAQKQVEQVQRDAQKQVEQAQRQAGEDARVQARAQADEARAQAEDGRSRAKGMAMAKGRGPGVPSGEGKVYAPGPFDSLTVDGAGQVRIVQADRDEVFVPGDENAQDSVDVELKGTRMHIDLPGGWKFWKGGNGALVEVRLRHLSKLTLSGSNDVVAPGPISGDQLTISMAGSGLARFDQLQVGRLNFDISGAGEGQLTGKVDQLHLSVSGKGKIGAEQLRTGSADVSISGVGNASLWTVGELRVQISGAGHVDYWGQPRVQKSISGFGSVDARGEKN